MELDQEISVRRDLRADLIPRPDGGGIVGLQRGDVGSSIDRNQQAVIRHITQNLDAAALQCAHHGGGGTLAKL